MLVTLYVYLKILNIKEISKAKKVSAIIFCLIMALILSIPDLILLRDGNTRDNILNYMCARAGKKAIELNAIISEDIKDITKNVITKLELETLLADLIENAIIAASYNSGKEILLSMGIVDDCYEIKIQDSGIPFDIETLINLGKKKATTHAGDGGSGIGYLTIFEILEACRASLIISEHQPESCSFTKTIKIRFDEKTNYIIESYRAEEIKTKASWTSKLPIAAQMIITDSA